MEIHLAQTDHDFEKQNLVTLKGGYDLLVCKRCGLKVKRRGVTEWVQPDGRSSIEKIYSCPNAPKDKYKCGNSIQITVCHASGPQFANLTPMSIHKIIEPPCGYKNGDKGVWVYGVGEPVKVLFDEFNFLTQ